MIPAAEVAFLFKKKKKWHETNCLEPSGTERQRDVKVTAPLSAPLKRLLIQI